MHCFQLIEKESGEAIPLATIDDRMRVFFGMPEDAESYLWGWKNIIGLAIACGKNWEEMKDIFSDSEKALKIISYLSERYDAEAWAE